MASHSRWHQFNGQTSFALIFCYLACVVERGGVLVRHIQHRRRAERSGARCAVYASRTPHKPKHGTLLLNSEPWKETHKKRRRNIFEKSFRLLPRHKEITMRCMCVISEWFVSLRSNYSSSSLFFLPFSGFVFCAPFPSLSLCLHLDVAMSNVERFVRKYIFDASAMVSL